jgi:hypothetical protein
VTRALRAVLVPFLATRAALLLAGWLALHLLPSGLTLQKGNLVYHPPGPAVFEMWARWDAEWYLLIADRGYGADDAFVGRPVAYQPGDDAGFFPLYPMLVRAMAGSGLPPLVAGVLVANLALLAALALLWDLARRDHGEETAGRAVWLLLAFPTSFFLSAVYAESIQLATLLGALALARAGRPLAAGGCAALCTLAKPTGVLVMLPLAIELWRGPDGRDPAGGRPAPCPADRIRRLASGLVPPAAALGAWMIACRFLFGSMVPFLARQERWRGPTTGPWRAFVRYFEGPQVHGAHHSTIDFACALLLVLSIPFMWRRLRASEAAWATVAILLPLGSTLWSFTRFAASIYPCHLLAAVSTRGSEQRFAAWIAVLLPMGGLLMALYAAWWWVG